MTEWEERGKRPVRVDGLTCFITTFKGLRLGKTEEDAVWIPKSQIMDSNIVDKGDSGHIVIPFWLAKRNELEFTELVQKEKGDD